MNLSIAPLLPTWLNTEPDLSVSVTLLRVSSSDLERLVSNADANAGKMAHLASMQRLDAIGGLDRLLEDSPAGKSLRIDLGVVAVERRHAHVAADNPTKEMGYLWSMEAEKSLLLFLADSAAEDNVWREDDLVGMNAVG